VLSGMGQAAILLGQMLGVEPERQVAKGKCCVAHVQVDQVIRAGDAPPHVWDVGMFLRTVPGVETQPP